MLIKHAYGQAIDYSFIAHLPVYGDLVAIKSSEHETEFSGDSPATLFMELPDGTQLQTTDFVAEDCSLSSIIIHDKEIHEQLKRIIYQMPEYQLFPGEMVGVWVCNNEFSSNWTVGIDFTEDFAPYEDCAYINPVKVYFMPSKEPSVQCVN